MGAAKKVLASTVHVDGTAYEAGTTPSAKVAELITNPKAWKGEATEPTPATQAAPPAAPASPADPPAASSEPAATAAPVGEPGSGDGLEAPPTTGKGSGKGPWAAYAAALGIDVPADADAAAIQALVADKNKA